MSVTGTRSRRHCHDRSRHSLRYQARRLRARGASMKLYQIANHGPIVVDSAAARDLPQPPGDPDIFRNWTLIAGPGRVPPNGPGKFAWYATASADVAADWTVTPNVELS